MNRSTTSKEQDRLVLICEPSPVALAYARQVTEQVAVLHPSLRVEVRPARAMAARGRGKRSLGAALRALARGTADAVLVPVATLPADLPEGFEVGVFMERLVPFQALVTEGGTLLEDLPADARVGVRDGLVGFQLASHRSDLRPVVVRQTVDRCLKRVKSGRLDGLIAPVCELEMLGWQDWVSEVLDSSLFLPLPGQGAVALVSTTGSRLYEKWLTDLDDAATRSAVEAELTLVREMNDVDGHLGALAQVSGGMMHLDGGLWGTDGREIVRDSVSGEIALGPHLGRDLAEKLFENGAHEFLRRPRRLTRALEKVSNPLDSGE